jgi:hypothetical protein
LIFALVASPAWAVPTLDTTTQGNWIGVYGSSGYILPSYNAQALPGGDEVSLPSFVSSYSYSGANAFIWAGSTTDVRAPQDPLNPGGNRTAATAYDNFTVDVTLSQPTHFQLGVYGLDWDSTTRVTNVTVNGDTATFSNVSPVVNAYNQGIWGLWELDLPAGVFQIQVVPTAGNGTISAITFDEIVEIPEPASIAVWLLMGASGLGFVWLRRRS